MKPCQRRRRRRQPKLNPKQRSVMALLLADCAHVDHLVENSRGAMERCACYGVAMHAVAELGKPLKQRPLPMSRRGE